MSVLKRCGGRISLLLGALAFGFAFAGSACSTGQEGDRCNPYLVANSTDECGPGLACTTQSYGAPTTGSFVSYATWSPNAPCAENYCCPTSGMSSNPNCQPGCNGGAAFICASNPAMTYVCEVADAQANGASTLPPFDSGAATTDAESDAEPDAEPDAEADAESDAAPDSGVADAPSEGG